MINDVSERTTIIDFLESLGYQSFGLDGDRIFKVYTEIEKELDSIYSGVGLRNLSHIGVLELKGADTIDYLHRITTNDLKNLSREKISKTIFTNEKGRIIDLTTLINFEDFQLLLCNDVHKMKLKNWIQKYLVTDDVKVDDVKSKYSMLEFLGPQAGSFVSMLCGDVSNSISVNSFRVVNTEGIIFFILKIEKEDGDLSFITISDLNNAQKIINYFLDRNSIFNFSFVGEEAYNIYRIGRGIPSAPNEINDEYNPHETGLAKYISFTKGCYIGQEVIARLQTYDKVQKHLAGVILDQQFDMTLPQIVRNNLNEEVGLLTSACYSPFHKKQIGLAYIKSAFCNYGSELKINMIDETQVNLIVSELPFVK